MKQCGHVYYKGQNKGHQCETRTRAAYCHKHADCQAATGENKAELARGDPILSPAAGAPERGRSGRLNSSVYYITINSNQPYASMSDEDKRKFRKFVDYLFDEGEAGGLYDYLHDTTSEDPRANIRQVQCSHYIEAGSKGGLVHCHAFLSIEHTGHIKLLLDDIRGLARRVFGHNLYVYCQAGSDPNIGYKRYIEKNAGAVDL